MDINTINGLTNTNFTTQYMEIQKENDETSSFKTAFENALKSGEDEEIKTAAKEVETYFINYLFKQMRQTVNKSGGLFEKSYAEGIFEEMLDEQYAKLATEAGGIGLADSMYEQMKENI